MACKSLEEVRVNIDRIDREIIELIAERGLYVTNVLVENKCLMIENDTYCYRRLQ